MITFTGLSVIELMVFASFRPGQQELGIDHEYAVIADQDGRIPAAAEDDIEVVVDLDGLRAQQPVELVPDEAEDHHDDEAKADQHATEHCRRWRGWATARA